MGPLVLDRARKLVSGRMGPLAVIASGETTVKVVGTGKGGRNQEIALSVAAAVGQQGGDLAMGSFGTDGIDGPTDAAGAFVDGNDRDRRARALARPRRVPCRQQRLCILRASRRFD